MWFKMMVKIKIGLINIAKNKHADTALQFSYNSYLKRLKLNEMINNYKN